MKLNELTATTITSMEVAQMVGKDHSKLLRDIRTYSEQLNEAKIGLVEFFKKSTYVDGKGESRPCFMVTKKGCEFIAHKLTGQKGTEFTAMYINRFHEMEEAIREERNIYKIRSTSLGEITSFVREMDRVMMDQNSHPSDIAVAFRDVCGQFGITLPQNFVREPRVYEPGGFIPIDGPEE